jgi:hypothetical protein
MRLVRGRSMPAIRAIRPNPLNFRILGFEDFRI